MKMPLTKIVDILNFLKQLREYEKSVTEYCRIPAPFFRKYINAEFVGRNGDEMYDIIEQRKADILGIAGEDIGPCDIIEQRKDGKFYRATNRNGDAMNNAIKLDTKAIRKRMAECAICNYDNELRIMMPTEEQRVFVDLVYGSCDTIHNADWTIRPGDKCEVSDNEFRCCKVGCVFDGFSGYLDYPFRVIYRDGHKDNHSSIRPAPEDSPERIKLHDAIARMEKDLAKMKEQVNRID